MNPTPTQTPTPHVYLPLIKLSKKEMKFVENDWHHACLTALNLKPSYDNMYNSFDYTFEEIQNVINKYGKFPDPTHYYWEELKYIEELKFIDISHN